MTAKVCVENEASHLTILKALVPRFHFPDSMHENAKILWIVRLRWLATLLLFLLAAPAYFTGLLTRETFPVYLGIVGVLIIFNLITQMICSENQEIESPIWLCFQLSFDLVILTVLLSVTGSVANPFVSLYFLHACLGAILIPARFAWQFLFLVHLALAFLQLRFSMQQGLDEGRIISFLIYHFLILAFWSVLRSLGEQVEKKHDRQTSSRLYLEKQDRLRAIGCLAAGFSHEFASPLNSAKLRLERLLRQGKSEDAEEALSAILACESVVREMNSSQLDTRHFQFKKVVVGDLLADIVDSWKELHPQTELNLEILDTGVSELPPINFAQVVLNLLDNAWEAAPEKKISILLNGDDQSFLLSFADQGPGFAVSTLKLVGEPFVTTKKSGTGLGLYVSQLFAQSLGGDIKIQNRPEGGALVQIAWPKSRGNK